MLCNEDSIYMGSTLHVTIHGIHFLLQEVHLQA